MTKDKAELAQRRAWFRSLVVQGAANRLDEAQLLELLLGYDTAQRDPAPLVRALTSRFQTARDVFSASDAALLGTEGMSEGALVLLRLVTCLERRAGPDATEPLKTVEQWIAYLQPLFLRQRRERVYLMCLSGEGRLLECPLLGEGSDSAVQLDVEQVCSIASRCGAEAVVLSHSHPSGIAAPSQTDRYTTGICRKALEAQGIRLLDHLIFADEDCVSMAESGLL